MTPNELRELLGIKRTTWEEFVDDKSHLVEDRIAHMAIAVRSSTSCCSSDARDGLVLSIPVLDKAQDIEDADGEEAYLKMIEHQNYDQDAVVMFLLDDHRGTEALIHLDAEAARELANACLQVVAFFDAKHADTRTNKLPWD
jgi:hypothetical protein